MSSNGVLYQIPNMRISDLVCNLNLMNLNVEETDIRNPKPDKIQKIFLEFVTYILDIQPQEFLQARLNMLNNLPYQEYHESVLKLLRLVQAVRRVLQSCGEMPYTFNIKDLIFPETKRLVTFFSQLMNFKLFGDSREPFFKSVEEANMISADTYKSKQQELKQIYIDIDELKMACEERVKEVEKIVAENAKKHVQLNESQQKGEKIKQEAEDLEKKIDEYNSQIAHLERNISELKKLSDDLDRKIIHSPDRVKTDIQNMITKSKKVENQHSNMQVRLIEKQGKIGEKKNVLQHLKTLKSLHVALVTCSDETKKLVSDLNTISLKIDDSVHEYEQLSSKEAAVKEEIASQDNVMSQLALEDKLRMQSNLENLDQIKSELKRKTSKSSEVTQEVLEIEKEITLLDMQYAQKVERYNNVRMKISAKYAELIEKIDKGNAQQCEKWAELLAFSRH